MTEEKCRFIKKAPSTQAFCEAHFLKTLKKRTPVSLVLLCGISIQQTATDGELILAAAELMSLCWYLYGNLVVW
jgi:hypothetical protein